MQSDEGDQVPYIHRAYKTHCSVHQQPPNRIHNATMLINTAVFLSCKLHI